METEQLIDTLLYGSKVEAQQAKKALVKVLNKKLNQSLHSLVQTKDRKKFSEEMVSIYMMIYGAYKNIGGHNKCVALSFLSHALFFLESNDEYFEIFLEYVREALKDGVNGNLRQIAVTTTSNTFALSSERPYGLRNKSTASKQKQKSDRRQSVIVHHITEIFDHLETCIETDEHIFPEAVEYMKSSVVKSHLLYLFEYDRFDVLHQMSELYEEDISYDDSKYYKRWRMFYEPLVESHPNIKKFIQHVPRYDYHAYDDKYAPDEIGLIVQRMLNSFESDGILSSEFFSGIQRKKDKISEDYFSIPKDTYFDISELVSDINDRAVLLEIFKEVYYKAQQAPISEVYWYDLVDSILSKYDDKQLRLQLLEEALEKLSVKVDVRAPIHEGKKNMIHYGIHEHRPVFRILLSYALCHHDFGDKEIAKEYYQFLLALNPYDNQGVRYLLAALFAGKLSIYMDELFDDGNKNQNWDKLEDFLHEQNAVYQFWNSPY